ncbi:MULTISPECIES: Fe-S cluster assembly protein IscX [Shewanella]|uniref:Fe-S cluster assembly protein IscX n=1 Tax=Shewanella salipaludis TaxID=2723052 RepID=A0A972FRG1_9GAMM|nr:MULTISPECIES: Fe-S cluster assembly protein IscX [Shewanella]MCE9684916.1 Fe-S cluster assembly protein IscX [Shewanella sp. AS16]NMH64377.1 Fe-S cluster assembly protein IscX [Shewanella salipaludis]
MGLKWIDSLDVALELLEKHPEVDPQKVLFVDLRDWVLELEDFDDDPAHCGERVLEAIQQCWIAEK